MLQQRSARSQLPMTNATCRQLGIAAEQTTANKNQHLPLHDLHIGQEVMYKDSVTKRWFLATIKALCSEPRSYQILTMKGVIYRRTQNHLKPYKSYKKTQKGQQFNKHFNQNNDNNNGNMQQSCPKRQIKIPVKLNV